MSSWLLWFGALGGPVAWTVQLILNYSLEEWFACSPSATDRGEVVGLEVPTAAIVTSSLLSVIAVAAGLVAFSCYRKIGAQPDDEVSSRARWMALAGIMNSILYLIVIAASFGPPLLLDVCEASP